MATAAIGLADQGVVSLVNFLTVVLLARALPLSEFGVFMLAHTVLMLLTGVQNALVAQPHNVLGAQRSGRAYAEFTSVLGVLQMLGSVLLTLIAVAVAFLWSAADQHAYAMVAYALAATIPAWMAQEFVRRVLYTQGNIVAAGVNNCLSYGLQIFGIAMVVTNVAGVTSTPVNALFALGLSSLIAAFFGAWQLRRRLAFPSIPRIAEVSSETWRLSKWLIAQQGVAWLGASGHGLLLSALLGPAAFGVYRVAYQIVNLLNPLRQAATNHLPSKFARTFNEKGVDGVASLSNSLAVGLTVPFVLCGVLVIVGAEPLAKLMFGSILDAAFPLHWIVALGALSYTLNFARAPFDYALLVAGGARAIFVRTLWLNAFVLSGGALLILSFGIAGALVSEVVTAILAALLTARVYGTFIRPHSMPSPPAELAQRSFPV